MAKRGKKRRKTAVPDPGIQQQAATQEASAPKPYEPNPNIRLILNGGGTTMDTATVPVEWHFSEEILQKNPQYIVICDHPMSLEDLRERENYIYGKRHLFKVEQLVGYMQLSNPGRHHFIAIVICGDRDSAQERAEKYMEREGSGYEKIVWFNDLNRDTITAVEFEVPQELFAERPKTGFRSSIWNWVNRWYEKDPVDECAYRKRKIFAFTLQPILLIVGRLLSGILGTLYTLAKAALLWFFGWKVSPMWENIECAWRAEGFDFGLREYPSYWRRMDDTHPYKYVPLYRVPVIAFVELAALAAGGYYLFITGFLIAALVALLALAFVVLLIARWSQNEERQRRLAEEQERAAKAEQEEYLARLRANLSLELTPRRVELMKILPKVGQVTRFKLGFWAVKAQVCKPFAK